MALPALTSDRVRTRAPYRCAVWGTGHMGVELTRAAVARGDVVPVAAIVTDPAKEGRDLGELAGLDAPLDAPATRDADAVLARDDVDAVYFCGIAGTQEIADALARIVRAGKEAITFSAIAHPATALGADAARELDAVARAAGHRILGTGLAPGFLVDVLPVVLASVSVDWTAITARCVLPMDDWGDMTLDAYGIGMPPGSHALTTARLSFLESVGIVIDALGVDVARSEETFDPIVSDRRRDGRRVIEPGHSTGVRRRFRATTSAGRTVEVEIVGVYQLDEERDGLREEYVVEVEGGRGAGVRAVLTGGWSPDPYPATAAAGLSALPGLISLPPGLYNAAQVPFAVRRPDWPSAEVTT
jgi:2,4-diaminopentanoate dehydrogenase